MLHSGRATGQLFRERKKAQQGSTAAKPSGLLRVVTFGSQTHETHHEVITTYVQVQEYDRLVYVSKRTSQTGCCINYMLSRTLPGQT